MALMTYAGIKMLVLVTQPSQQQTLINLNSKTSWSQIRLQCELVQLMNVKAGLTEI